jgi:pyruvate,water dikinase
VAVLAPARELFLPLAAAGQTRRTSAKRVGGKAAGLGRLLRAGFPVPEGWVLDGRVFTESLERLLPHGYEPAALIRLAGTRAGVDRAARARDRVLAEPLPAELLRAVDGLWAEVAPRAPWGLAIRSSATCEDADATSMAGLAMTVLGVRGPEGIGQAIREVWASAFLPQALAYLAQAKIRDLAMAVLLQPMAVASAAGVLFTQPPAGLTGPSWGEGERLIQATVGLGAPAVAGTAATDIVRLARDGGAVVDAVIAEKQRALIVGPHGLVDVDVDAERTREPALSFDAVRQLGRLAHELDRLGSGGFDVEFAVETSADGAEKVLLLQARPLSGHGYPEGGDAETVWSRGNVGEALPGVATPLTWSVALGFADEGFREAFGALGCRVPRGAHLVSSVHGRFYLNLTAFMRVAAQVPGLTPASILGLSGGASDAAIRALERQTEGVSKRRFLARLPVTAPRLIAQHARLDAEIDAFEAEITRALGTLAELDLMLLPDDSLATTLRGARKLLDRTGTLMLRAASASLATHLALVEALALRAGTHTPARSAGDAGDAGAGARLDRGVIQSLAQTLTAGAREQDHPTPGVALARVALVARADPHACEALTSGQVRAVAELPMGRLRRALERFLRDHGDRALREAELSTPRWREDPRDVLAMLAAMLRGPASDPDRALTRARAAADRELARLEARLTSVEVAILRRLVLRAQRLTSLRERMRTWVTRVLGALRTIALDVDRRLRRLDPTLAEGAVFFCTIDELMAALASGHAELGSVVRLRRAEYARDAARPDPPPTFIGSPPAVTLPPAAGARLHGLPASAGVVEGRVRVLRPGELGLDLIEPGDVLVSRSTDAALSPLFLVAAAVVTELGGPLSHAAIVAREYGVPAVVSVPGATAALRDGDRVRVDGDRGYVDRLDLDEPLS